MARNRPGWREATTADIHAAAQNENPDILFLSAPCKGFSGLLSETRSRTDKYQALNALTLHGVWLALEAWKNDPVSLIVFENVPRIANRGRSLLDRIVALLRSYGYAVAETTHDCGELGGLAQAANDSCSSHGIWRRCLRSSMSRRSAAFALWVTCSASCRCQVSAWRPMHRVPSLQWKTWVRLAFVEAGKDWRSLNRLKVEDGMLREYLIVPETGLEGSGQLGVNKWHRPSGTVAGASRPGNGSFSVADPRWHQSARWNEGNSLGVKDWKETASTIGAGSMPGQGVYSVADPRHHGPAKLSNEFRIVKWDWSSVAVTGAHGSGQCVADPRPDWQNRYGNRHSWRKGVQGGWMSVADPRRSMGTHTNEMRVVDWNGPGPTVTGSDRVVLALCRWPIPVRRATTTSPEAITVSSHGKDLPAQFLVWRAMTMDAGALPIRACRVRPTSLSL